jgi:hypothetical protein
VTDTDGDGTYEILQSYNDCNPDCAGGTITSATFKWNGTDYAPAAPPPGFMFP